MTTKIMTMTMVILMAVTLMMMAVAMAIIKNNDLVVRPMSRTPSSDDHNGDRMIVKMILKKKSCDDETYEQDTRR